MKIGGNEIGFLFNVRARINIAQLTETKSLDKIDDLFGGDEEKVVENVYKIARILNHEYEMKLRKDQGKSVDLTENYAIIKRDDLDELDNFVQRPSPWAPTHPASCATCPCHIQDPMSWIH